LARPELAKYELVKRSTHVITTSDGEKMVFVFRFLSLSLFPLF